MNGEIWQKKRIGGRQGPEGIWGQDCVLFLYTKSRILKVIREWTGSQCSEQRIGDILSRFPG